MKYVMTQRQRFYAWQPSTWPTPPHEFNEAFRNTLKAILHESLLDEIRNVIEDAPTLRHRGHVVALSIFCAIDTISSYAFRNSKTEICVTCKRTDKVGARYKKYIQELFPSEYQPLANKLYHLYRNSMTHSWNLFEAAMLPGDESISEVNGTIIFGLRHFFCAFKISVDRFLERLIVDHEMQKAAMHRYRELRHTARP